MYFTSPAPTAPRLLRVVDSSSCQLDWLPPAQPNGAVTYTVQYQTSGSFMDLTTGLTTTHHSAVDLPSGTSVTVRVQAVNTAGTSTSNNVVLQGLYVRHDCAHVVYFCHIIANIAEFLQIIPSSLCSFLKLFNYFFRWRMHL